MGQNPLCFSQLHWTFHLTRTTLAKIPAFQLYPNAGGGPNSRRDRTRQDRVKKLRSSQVDARRGWIPTQGFRYFAERGQNFSNQSAIPPKELIQPTSASRYKAASAVSPSTCFDFPAKENSGQLALKWSEFSNHRMRVEIIKISLRESHRLDFILRINRFFHVGKLN